MADWLECSVKVSEDVLAQEVNEETVLLDLKSECYFGLDPVGTRCWQLLNAAPGVRDAYEVLLEEYEVESAQLRDDRRLTRASPSGARDFLPSCTAESRTVASGAARGCHTRDRSGPAAAAALQPSGQRIAA
jgi:hypothetical protein